MNGNIQIRDEGEEFGYLLEEVLDLGQESRALFSVEEKPDWIGHGALVPVYILNSCCGVRLTQRDTQGWVPWKLESVFPPVLHKGDIGRTLPGHRAIRFANSKLSQAVR